MHPATKTRMSEKLLVSQIAALSTLGVRDRVELLYCLEPDFIS